MLESLGILLPNTRTMQPKGLAIVRRTRVVHLEARRELASKREMWKEASSFGARGLGLVRLVRARVLFYSIFCWYEMTQD